MTEEKNKYTSRIEKPTIYTTSKGGRYVRPFDILRSEQGRATINRFAEDDAECNPEPKKSTSTSEKRAPGGSTF